MEHLYVNLQLPPNWHLPLLKPQQARVRNPFGN
jgi:hypothetical protein